DHLLRSDLKIVWEKMGVAAFRAKLMKQKLAGNGPSTIQELEESLFDATGNPEEDDDWDVEAVDFEEHPNDDEGGDDSDENMAAIGSSSSSSSSSSNIAARVMKKPSCKPSDNNIGPLKDEERPKQKLEDTIGQISDPRLKRVLMATMRNYGNTMRKETNEPTVKLSKTLFFDQCKDMALPELQPHVKQGLLKVKAKPAAAPTSIAVKKQSLKIKTVGKQDKTSRWKVEKYERGPDDKNAGGVYHIWVHPSGNKFRSLKQAKLAGFIQPGEK
ncbi:unnamed protein product, partial [Polarella glacialis]